MIHRRNKKSGFTLIEILVSVTIFALLIGIAMASYLNLSQALKKENIQRRLYSELTRIMEDTDRWGKFFTIDYEWYTTNNITINTQTGTPALALISKDGKARLQLSQEATTESEEEDKWLGIYKEVKDDTDQWGPDAGFTPNQFERLTSAELQVEHAQFFIFPATKTAYFQPKITLVLSGGMLNPFAKNIAGTAEGRYEHFSLQTSFSIRPYTSSLAP